jgi:hypothetical protein
MNNSMVAGVETITPDRARAYLVFSNDGNRKLVNLVVARYAADMIAGRWDLTGEPIIFDDTGRLIDGHHRLHAIVRSDIPIQFLVVRGASEQSVNRIDTGMARSPGQIAHMNGIVDGNSQAAVMKMILFHEQYGISRFNNSSLHPTHAEVIEALKSRPSLIVSIRKGRLLGRLAPGSVGAFCYYLFSKQNLLLAERFWDELTGDGSGLELGNPALALRSRLVENKLSKAKFDNLTIISFFFRAWLGVRDGRPVKLIKAVRTEGTVTEGFPKI